MANIIKLPDYKHISSWIMAPSLPLVLSDLRNRAAYAYKDSLDSFNDIEFEKILALNVDWSKLTYRRWDEPFVKLVDGAWQADLKIAYSRSEYIYNLLHKQAQCSNFKTPIQHLCEAAWNRSLVIYVPENTFITQPIELFPQKFTTTLISKQKQLLINRVIIIVNAHAKVTFSNTISNLFPGVIQDITGVIDNNAQVNFINSEHKKIEDTTVYSDISWDIKDHAQVNTVDLNAYTKNSLRFINYNLLEDNAYANHVTYSGITEDQQSGLITKQIHKAPNAQSSVIVKSALQKNARSFYKSIIDIGNSAVNSKANQIQVSLMLGEDACNYAKPMLNIKNENVSCSHGSATGQINQAQVWYLCSRGFSKSQAENFIIDGFFYEDYDKISDLVSHNDINALTERLKNAY